MKKLLIILFWFLFIVQLSSLEIERSITVQEHGITLQIPVVASFQPKYYNSQLEVKAVIDLI